MDIDLFYSHKERQAEIELIWIKSKKTFFWLYRNKNKIRMEQAEIGESMKQIFQCPKITIVTNQSKSKTATNLLKEKHYYINTYDHHQHLFISVALFLGSDKAFYLGVPNSLNEWHRNPYPYNEYRLPYYTHFFKANKKQQAAITRHLLLNRTQSEIILCST